MEIVTKGFKKSINFSKASWSALAYSGDIDNESLVSASVTNFSMRHSAMRAIFKKHKTENTISQSFSSRFIPNIPMADDAIQKQPAIITFITKTGCKQNNL